MLHFLYDIFDQRKWLNLKSRISGMHNSILTLERKQGLLAVESQ